MGSPMQIVEIGTLRTLENSESSFIGSSTGIYFVNTVRNAFKASKEKPPSAHGPSGAATSGGAEQERPSPLEDFLMRDGVEKSRSASPTRPVGPASTIPRGPSYDAAPPGIGRPPDAATAKKLLVLYFKLWHPLFPFLHGPTVFQEIEALYYPCCRAIIAQCIFNIAQAGMSRDLLPRYSRIESAHSLIFSLSSLATKQDLHSLQALCAAQLYLVTAGSFRSASAIAGLLTKSIFHSGLHRCPYRYSQLSDHDRDLRKRLFWTAYVLDRYLSQGLGIPLGFQDSDIDVCMPGTEKHTPVSLRPNPTPETLRCHLPGEQSAASRDSSASMDGHHPQMNGLGESFSNSISGPSSRNVHRDIAIAGLVGYSQLTGRAVELFHKSIHVRSVDHSKILYITADIHAWWNAMPRELVSWEGVTIPRGEPSEESSPCFGPIFTILYQQLLLLVNRPCLSLPSTTPEFMSCLQTCITAGRTAIGALEMQLQLRQPFFLPECLSSAWMSGLILVFACQVGFYPAEKAYVEIAQCLQILRIMKDHWKSAKNYYHTLSVLFSDLQSGSSVKNMPDFKRANSDDLYSRKRPRYSAPAVGNGYSSSIDLAPSAAIHREPFMPHSNYQQQQQQQQQQQPKQSPALVEIRNSSNPPDINAANSMRPYHSPDGSVQPQSFNPAPTPTSQQSQLSMSMHCQQPLTASDFLFALPCYEPQQWPDSHIFTDPAYTGSTDGQVLQDELDPWLGDPMVNSMDIFGQVTWGSLNADCAYNLFEG